MSQVLNGYTINDEERRQALRDEKRRDLAAIAVKFERIDELRQIIRSIDADIDEADRKHAKQTKPLQDELAEIDDKRVLAILKRAKAKDTSERRRELLKQIADHNVTLETTIEACKRSKQKIEQEIRELTAECTGRNAIENDLARLATPEQLDRQWLLGEKLKHAQRWREHCRERIGNVNEFLADRDKLVAGDADKLEQRLRKWRLAANDAGNDVSQIEREMAELREAMLND